MSYRELYTCPHEHQAYNECELGCCGSIYCVVCGKDMRWPPSPEPSASRFVISLTAMLLFILSLGGAFLAFLLGAVPQ